MRTYGTFFWLLPKSSANTQVNVLSTHTWVYVGLCSVAFYPLRTLFTTTSSFGKLRPGWTFLENTALRFVCIQENRVFWRVPFVRHHLCVRCLFMWPHLLKQQWINSRKTQRVLLLNFPAGLYTCVQINVQLLSHHTEDQKCQILYLYLILFLFQYDIQY